MSLIEVLMAMVVMLVGLFAIFGALLASGSGTITAGRSAAMAQVGEQVLQSVEALPYANVADSSAPTQTSTTDTTDPTYYLVTGPVAGSSCTTATACYQWDPTKSSSAEPLAIDGVSGKVAPGPTTVVVPSPTAAGCTTSTTTNCQMTFAVYIFVTNATDAICVQSGVTCAAGVPSYKRITVVVDNTGPHAPFKPLYFSSFVRDKVGTTNNPLYATGATGATTANGTSCLDGGVTVACTH